MSSATAYSVSTSRKPMSSASSWPRFTGSRTARTSGWLAQQLAGAVGRRVVDHHQTSVARGYEPRRARAAPRETGARVPVHGDDGHLGGSQPGEPLPGLDGGNYRDGPSPTAAGRAGLPLPGVARARARRAVLGRECQPERVHYAARRGEGDHPDPVPQRGRPTARDARRAATHTGRRQHPRVAGRRRRVRRRHGRGRPPTRRRPHGAFTNHKGLATAFQAGLDVPEARRRRDRQHRRRQPVSRS